MTSIPFPAEPFPGAFYQRCVKCEAAAEASLARRIEDGQWAVLVTCLDASCRYAREIDVDFKGFGGIDKDATWQ